MPSEQKQPAMRAFRGSLVRTANMYTIYTTKLKAHRMTKLSRILNLGCVDSS